MYHACIWIHRDATHNYRLCAKINADFGHNQGNSVREGDVKKQWNDLFLYQAERDIPRDCSHSQKNNVCRQLCDVFMVSDSIMLV